MLKEYQQKLKKHWFIGQFVLTYIIYLICLLVIYFSISISSFVVINSIDITSFSSIMAGIIVGTNYMLVDKVLQ